MEEVDQGDGLILAISDGVAKLHHAFVCKTVVIQIDHFQCQVGFQTRRQCQKEIVSKLDTRNGHVLDAQVGLYGVGKGSHQGVRGMRKAWIVHNVYFGNSRIVGN